MIEQRDSRNRIIKGTLEEDSKLIKYLRSINNSLSIKQRMGEYCKQKK